MKLLSTFLIGMLFGGGLLLSGMTQPHRVIGFLDLWHWDPTLLFVMGGALLVYAPLYQVICRCRRPVLDSGWHIPANRAVDRRLVVGAAVFGIGWGLGGYCPGPALTSLGAVRADALIFVVAMAGGMLVQGFFKKKIQFPTARRG